MEESVQGLSAGRVQSVAVRLIVDREREITAFTPQEYWTIQAELESKSKIPPATVPAMLRNSEAGVAPEPAWQSLNGSSQMADRRSNGGRGKNQNQNFLPTC